MQSNEFSYQITDPAEAGIRLDVFLSQQNPAISRQKIQEHIKNKCVSVNQTIITKPRYALKANDTITFTFIMNEVTEDKPQAMDLAIVHEDNDILVINKPAGLVVHPGSGQADSTLLNGLLHHAPHLKQLPRAGIVHRLDKDTSGLMVIAKSMLSYQKLVDCLKERQVKRIYHALVYGHPPLSWTVEAPIARHPTQRTLMSVQPHGKPAKTHFLKLQELGPYTLLQCQLETGRTHQIRVHLLHSNHPIVGDPTYRRAIKMPQLPHPEATAAIQTLNRQFLHAISLAFHHPLSNAPLTFTAQYPEELGALQTRLETLYE